MEVIAGIDVGGTFTDVVLHDSESGELRIAKVFSTAGQQAEGLLTGLGQLGTPIEQLDVIVHGTTVATNAVLERKGDRCALVTTRGFRDVLELRRRDRPTTYGLTSGYTPIVPRSRSFEIDERIDAEGCVEVALEDEGIRRLADELRAAAVESVAVCLLNSYANPVHEQQLVAALAELLPGVALSASHEICPEAGEFERANTSAVNAFVRATMSRYLDTVQERLESQGFKHEVQVMQSNGGLIPARRAGQFAVRTLLSGPAAGTVGAAAFGAAAGLDDVISCDMGGTSFDVALIPGGDPAITAEKSIDYGVPIKLPMIDITTIAAGGGSIASLDRAGILQVGPESAGSHPGPACYGRGGTRPTVTDANIVLGRIAAKQQLGTQEGFMLDATAAENAIRDHIAEPLGITVKAAALAIVRIANEKMARAIRTVSVDKGYDPRKFALVGFGGAGPMHIVELARTVGARTVLIPPLPGALSAYGCLIADAKYDYVTAVNATVDGGMEQEVQRSLAMHRTTGEKVLHADGFAENAVSVEHFAEMSFSKQMYSLRVPLGDRETGWTAERLSESFLAQYATTYGGRIPSRSIKLINLRTVVTGARSLAAQRARTPARISETASREITFDDLTVPVAVLSRDSLTPGQTLEGPLVLEQTDSTIILPPRTTAVVHDNGSIVVEVAL
ncbi:hydantoinase/oxoprolinase family protein [Saccharopolyspora spinosa]|uniref:N-methylhydantoinase A n=1 Tax=Saccharopolyspora spinosa TaxID=60894 RepID=Q6JHQ1_SACSN|nr:hydantoinase/oxoprolinase family protein [Saccharopolyspora spinosa]AAS00406.1 N-methylhydantoinase beta subunit [Saccharopolyspora spinosa NRRL 18395]PKW16126.1 N-methylhydantoinase A [Saccharopolyspora spinosa]